MGLLIDEERWRDEGGLWRNVVVWWGDWTIWEGHAYHFVGCVVV